MVLLQEKSEFIIHLGSFSNGLFEFSSLNMSFSIFGKNLYMSRENS